jgi:hypothetical protein
MDIQKLQDDELVTGAREWRQRSLRGEKHARGIAHELEREVRRRFGAPRTATPPALPAATPLAVLPQARPQRWKPW